MRRREFFSTISAAVLWPLFARGENAERVRRIGVLDILEQGDSASTARIKAFMDRLQQLGWSDKNIEVYIRHAGGSTDRLNRVARELVEDSVEVLVTSSTPAVLAARQAGPSVPIVFAAIGDPVGAGVVASLSRPGGNITGLSLFATDLSRKRLEILKEALPGLKQAAIFWNPQNASIALQFQNTEQAARLLGIEILSIPTAVSDDFAAAVAAAVNKGADALLLTSDPEQVAARGRIIEQATKSRLPVVGEYSQFAESGALLSYGPHLVDNWRRAGDYVNKILRGEKAADIPVEQPVRFELVVNVKTAKILNLSLPLGLLARADEVIE
jgi:putative ABC transport system substrate-binding protein